MLSAYLQSLETRQIDPVNDVTTEQEHATQWAELALYVTIDMQLTRLVGSQGIILVMGFNCKDEEAALMKVASFAKANNGFWWFCKFLQFPHEPQGGMRLVC